MGLKEVAGKFAIQGGAGEIVPFGSGHIHATYHLINTDRSCPDYLLQQINTNVFHDVDGMMRNIALVTSKLEQSHQEGDQGRSLTLVPPRKGGNYVRTGENECWRMYVFLSGLEAYDTLDSSDLVRECGKGYGRFVRQLSGLDARDLAITIPEFHNISHRLEQLEDARKHTERSDGGQYAVVERLSPVMVALNERPVPLRVTHNDTKSNNILFDHQGRAACVVDLDTVMPGKIWYDIGDSLRSILTRYAEDESMPGEPDVRTGFYTAYLEGYLRETGDLLEENEWAGIPVSGAYMAFIMGVRFLADHLNGDVYYRTEYAGHNLDRAKNQLKLAETLFGLREEFERLLEEVRERL